MNIKTHLVKAFTGFSLAVLCTLALTSCATAPGRTADGSMPDPFEGYNRAMFKFNDAVDRNMIEPVARGYRYVAPQPVRNGVNNFLRNLKSPITMANKLLQGDFDGLGNEAVRFVVNTTVGVGGIFDVAGDNGHKFQQADFGQTLGKWGVGQGAYLIVPILGPTTIRDGVGLLVDSFADPLNIYLYNTDHEEWVYARWGVTFLATREELLDAVDDLRKHSLDYYAATRSAYAQHRQALVDGHKGRRAAAPSIPDYSKEHK